MVNTIRVPINMPPLGNIVSAQGKTCTEGIQCDLQKTQTSKRNKVKNKKLSLEPGSRRNASDAMLYLQKCIEQELSKVKPTRDSVACGDRCLQELNSVVWQLGPEWSVQPFGSFANGFATIMSDLDITCFQAGHVVCWKQSDFVLGALSKVLGNHPSFTIEDQILGARVPILRLRFESSLDIDMSCHNRIPLMNTRLLRAYSLVDSRIRDLGIAIKLWSKHVGVCDAKKSNLSSYSFTLLVIYFLQVHPEIKLPVIPVHAFAGQGEHELDEHAIVAMTRFSCELTLAELLFRFFEFYCKADNGAFLWGSEVVSVRCGERRVINDPIFNELRGRQSQRLHIEDPYQLERNLDVVLGENEENHLQMALREAFHEMQSFRPPRGLIPASECATWLKSGSDMQAATPRIVSENCDESTTSGSVTQFPESSNGFDNDSHGSADETITLREDSIVRARWDMVINKMPSRKRHAIRHARTYLPQLYVKSLSEVLKTHVVFEPYVVVPGRLRNAHQKAK